MSTGKRYNKSEIQEIAFENQMLKNLAEQFRDHMSQIKIEIPRLLKENLEHVKAHQSHSAAVGMIWETNERVKSFLRQAEINDEHPGFGYIEKEHHAISSSVANAIEADEDWRDTLNYDYDDSSDEEVVAEKVEESDDEEEKEPLATRKKRLMENKKQEAKKKVKKNVVIDLTDESSEEFWMGNGQDTSSSEFGQDTTSSRFYLNIQ